jgi:hypothetical protein
VPLYIGEFGAVAAADRASRLRWTRGSATSSNASRSHGRTGTSPPDFGVYDLERGAWDAELLDALLGAEGS